MVIDMVIFMFMAMGYKYIKKDTDETEEDTEIEDKQINEDKTEDTQSKNLD